METLATVNADNDIGALRKVYGDSATFDTVGMFTLVHLDSPSEAVRIERVNEFNPDGFFFDGCPLCDKARVEGGHVVYGPAVEPGPLARLAEGYRELCRAVVDVITETERRPAAFTRESERGARALEALQLIRRGIGAFPTDEARDPSGDKQAYGEAYGLVLDGVHPLLTLCNELGTFQPGMQRIWDHAVAVRALVQQVLAPVAWGK